VPNPVFNRIYAGLGTFAVAKQAAVAETSLVEAPRPAERRQVSQQESVKRNSPSVDVVGSSWHWLQMLRLAGLGSRYRAIVTYLGSLLTLSVSFIGHSLGFVILARSLTSSEIGILAMLTAASSLGAVWCEFGVCEMARRRLGRDSNEYPDVLGHSLILIFGLGTAISLLLAPVAAAFLHTESYLSALFVAGLIVPSNVVLFVFIGFTEQVIIARGNLRRANLVNAGYGLARTAVTIIACIGFNISDLAEWAPWHFTFYLSVCLACWAGIWQYGRPRWTILRDELPRGATMSVWGFLQALRQNVDLLALSAVAPPALLGNYSVARRVLNAASMVGQALDRIVYSRLVVAGRDGVKMTTHLAKKYATYLIGPLLLTSVAVFVTAEVVPWVFGNKYGDAVHLVRVLSIVIVAWGLQNLAFDALNAAQQHTVRLLVSIGAACLGCSLIAGGAYLWQVPGVLVGVIAAEVVITGGLWLALIALARRA
jgi:O-antigen/teichoic acid export membrane protein